MHFWLGWEYQILFFLYFFFFQAEDGIRDLVRSRGLGDVYKRQPWMLGVTGVTPQRPQASAKRIHARASMSMTSAVGLSLIHI